MQQAKNYKSIFFEILDELVQRFLFALFLNLIKIFKKMISIKYSHKSNKELVTYLLRI